MPGVAQRTGSTIYYIEIFPEAAAQAAGKDPVLALMPVPGELDVVIASELMEAGRAVQRGFVTADRTTLIASTRTRLFDDREDRDRRRASGRGEANRSRQSGGQEVPVRRFFPHGAKRPAASSAHRFSVRWRQPARCHLRGSSLKRLSSAVAWAWNQAWRHLRRDLPRQQRLRALPLRTVLAPSRRSRSRSLARPATAGRDTMESDFPAVSHEILFAGIVRCADFQDEAYAAQYLRQLDALRDLDADYGNGDYILLRETGRYLALWMCYEDAVRVADLKIRRSRFERVQKEVRASADQLVRINEFLHPGRRKLRTFFPRDLAAG